MAAACGPNETPVRMRIVSVFVCGAVCPLAVSIRSDEIARHSTVRTVSALIGFRSERNGGVLPRNVLA